MKKGITTIFEELPIILNLIISSAGLILFASFATSDEWEAGIYGIILYSSAVVISLKFYENEKSVSQGSKRLILTLNILGSVILGVSLFEDEAIFIILRILIVSNIFWILTYVGLWIYKGYHLDSNVKKHNDDI